MLSTKYVYKSYIFREDLALNNLQGFIGHKNQHNKTDKIQNRFYFIANPSEIIEYTWNKLV